LTFQRFKQIISKKLNISKNNLIDVEHQKLIQYSIHAIIITSFDTNEQPNSSAKKDKCYIIFIL
jgi:hypothetical protein